jgi:hypothetical protein
MFYLSRVIWEFGAPAYVEWWLRVSNREMGQLQIETDEKGVLHQNDWCYSSEVGSNRMKKVFLIVTLSLFGVTAVFTAPPVGSVAFAQRKEKDDKKNSPGPPVIKDKGSRDKPKEPPPKKDKRPS